MRYYLDVNGQKHGPFTPLDLVRLGINGKNKVMREDSKNWIRVADDPFLFEFVIDPKGAAAKDKTDYTPRRKNNAGDIAANAATDAVASGMGCSVTLVIMLAIGLALSICLL